MKIDNNSPLKIEIARQLNIPVECIDNVMIHAETTAGTMVLHTLPTLRHYWDIMERLTHDHDVIDLTGEVN